MIEHDRPRSPVQTALAIILAVILAILAFPFLLAALFVGDQGRG